MAIVILPILEEIAFRSVLRLNKMYVFFSSAVLSYYFLNVFLFEVDNTNIDNNFILRIILSLLMGGGIMYIYIIKQEKISNFWQLNFNYIFYFFALLFAIVHINNYKSENILLLIFVVIPQFIGALFLGYIRVKMGLFYSILYHLLYNAIAILIIFLLKNI